MDEIRELTGDRAYLVMEPALPATVLLVAGILLTTPAQTASTNWIVGAADWPRTGVAPSQTAS